MNKNVEPIEVEFKPISSGLGFHHQPQFKKEITVKLPKIQPTSTAANQQEFYRGDLAQFYAQAKIKEAQVNAVKIQEKSLEKVFRPALTSQRMMAWVLDQFFVLSLVSITLLVMERFTAIGIFNELLKFSEAAWTSVGMLWMVYQIFYFTFSERIFKKTIGKEIVGIEIRSKNNPDLMTSLVRGLIKVFSILSFGILAWYDVQSKATDTQVIRQ